MVSPAQRRDGVAWAQKAYRLSQRRAAGALGVALSSVRYRSLKAPREPLRARIREIAAARVSYGYRQVHTLLRREGWPVNHKLVYRLYKEEGLTLQRKRPKRRRSSVPREQSASPTRPNERWAMDFVHDALSGGSTIRVLAVIDVHTRECVVLRAGRGFRGSDVAEALAEAGAARGALPELISVDNGTEFTSKSLDHWSRLEPGEADLQPAGQADGQRPRRSLQLRASARVPIAALVYRPR